MLVPPLFKSQAPNPQNSKTITFSVSTALKGIFGDASLKFGVQGPLGWEASTVGLRALGSQNSANSI